MRRLCFTLLVLLVGSACADDAFIDDWDAGDAGDAAPDAPFDAGPDTRPPPPIDSGPPPPDDVDGFVEYQMEAGGIPGVAASIVTREGIAWSGYYGFADIETDRLVDADSLFIVASISKTLTTLALMQLVDEGLLDLDAAADDHLPYAFRHPDFVDDEISTRMLVTHTTGLHDDFAIMSRVTTMGDPDVTLGDFAEGYVSPGGTYYESGNWGTRPSSRREYCNVNFAVVGHLVESIRGEDLRAVSQTYVFDPLGMTSSGWFLADVDAANLATPYTFDGRVNAPLPHNGFSYYPASSLRTNIPDLSRFLQATLRDGELDGTRVLSESLSQSMREVQRRDLNPNQMITWRFHQLGEVRWIAHTGSTFGASAIIAYLPDDGIGMIVMTNSDAYIRGRLGIRGSQDALEAIFERIADEALLFR